MPLISGWILRRAALLIAILVMALGVRSISAAAETTGNQTKSFDIPAGDARQMLKLFATQAGSQIVFTVESVEGVTTNAVKGEMTPRAAIDSMLAGTDLVVVADENTGAFAVRRKKGGSQEKNVQSESTHGLPAAGNVTKARDEPILLDVFTVNGSYAGSLEMAAQTKQDAAAIVEVLAPEDSLVAKSGQQGLGAGFHDEESCGLRRRVSKLGSNARQRTPLLGESLYLLPPE